MKERSDIGYKEGQMPSMHGGGVWITSIDEVS